MDDRTLLEKAAKAAGMSVGTPDGWVWCANVGPSKTWGLWRDVANPTAKDPNPRPLPGRWNPILSDADAFRLAVKLRIALVQFSSTVRANAPDGEDCHEGHGTDPEAATRRAIVRAAAAMADSTAGE